MKTEKVVLELETTALYVARAAAERAHLSLSEWLSKVARDQGIAAAAEVSAEQESLHPDEPPGWADAVADRMFPALRVALAL